MTPFHKYPHHPDLEERGQPEELCGLETSDPDWQSWFSHFWWARIWRSTLVTRRWIAPWPSDKWQWKWENNLTRKRKSPKHGVSVVEGFSMEFRRLGPVKGSQCRTLHISLEKMRWPPYILATLCIGLKKIMWQPHILATSYIGHFRYWFEENEVASGKPLWPSNIPLTS